MRVLSGIQPSGRGNLHIGNYFGAIKQYLELMNKGYECFYFIANYHAMTSIQDGDLLRNNTRELAKGYLAAGIDPNRATFFRQSDVPEILELYWILSCLTPMGLLERCVSYKDKVEQGLKPNHGLFAYPVLQAADILIVNSNLVPVGQDQKQHVEVTRDIAIKFNNQYGEILTVPEPYIVTNTAVVPGLDGRKMSKSYDNILELFEPAKQVEKKIKRIPTDSTPIEDPKNPDTCHVFGFLKLVASDEEIREWDQRYRQGGMGYGEVKKRTAELMNEFLEPLRQKYEELSKDEDFVEDVLHEGGLKARKGAKKLMEQVCEAVGIVKAKTV